MSRFQISNRKIFFVDGLAGDAEYLRNCNAGIFPKWICRNISEVMLDVGISLKYQCWNISEVPLLEYLRNYLVCRNISKVDNAG